MIFINNVISPLKVNNRFYCVKSIYTGKNDTAYVLPDMNFVVALFSKTITDDNCTQ